MKYLISHLLITVLIGPAASYAGDWAGELLFLSDIPLGGNDPNEATFQQEHNAYEGIRLVAKYYLGDDRHGLAIGASYSKDQNEFLDFRDNGHRYRSEMTYPGILLGYWLKSDSGHRISVEVLGGQGIFSFHDPATANTYKDTCQVIDISIKGSYALETPIVRVPIIGGIGMLNQMPKDFTLNGQTFKGSYFTDQVYLSLGVGVEF